MCNRRVGFPHSQLLQQLQFALHLSSSVGIVAKPVDEDLEDRTAAVSVCYSDTRHVCVPLRYLYVLPVLLLRLVLPLLVLQSVLFGFDEVLVVAAVAVQPLGV